MNHLYYGDNLEVLRKYHHKVMGRNYACIQIVTIQDILENGKRLDIPLNLEVLKSAERQLNDSNEQLTLPFADLEAV